VPPENMQKDFQYEKTLKTNADNSFLNLQQYLFVTSKQITKLLYYTPVTPHFVILLSLIFGVTASYMIIQEDKLLVVLGAILLFYKNVLDKVDGSLARAKGLDSRRGRFYDSIADFIVTLTSFSTISYKLYLKYHHPVIFVIGFAAMLCSMLQCSYFIFYQVSFIRFTGKITVNRLIETVTEDDIRQQDKWTTFLQRVFILIYGWQDMLFAALDNFLYKKLDMATQKIHKTELNKTWYCSKPFLTLASSLSIGTHIFLICLAAVFDMFEYYLFVNLICMNLLLILSVIYHYYSTKKYLNK
jgi:phosphatidylglycerophosphate synthase